MEADEYITASQAPATKREMSKKMRRKVADCDFQYRCEWNGCTHESSSMNEFNHHMSLHRRGYTMHLGTDEQISSDEYRFFCQWQGCNAQIEGQLDDFSRHVFYHTFHQYLKFLGQHIQKVEKLEPCQLDTSSHNVIPELPEKLMCRWEDCGNIYDNPYIFYAHVGHHCEDFPKDFKDPVNCKWEGCPVITKNLYKMKEHIRSHTQAKVVACPTCGSLFASNTRFIDHLQRQSQNTDLNFECSHCNNRFGTERILREHMRHHVNHYKCPLCDMTCHSPSAVRDHVRYRHSQERSFQCPKCEYRAKTASDLQCHNAIHAQKGTYSCAKPGCEKIIRTKRQLLEYYCHEHEVTKQYQCHICHMSFARGWALTNHLKEMHNYRWPSGHKRFRYKLHEDGVFRLQIIRYESIEVTQQILGHNLSPDPATLPTVSTETDGESKLNIQDSDSCDSIKHCMEEKNDGETLPDKTALPININKEVMSTTNYPRLETKTLTVDTTKYKKTLTENKGDTEMEYSTTNLGDLENVRTEIDNSCSDAVTDCPNDNNINSCTEKTTNGKKRRNSDNQESPVKSKDHKKRVIKESTFASNSDNSNGSDEGEKKLRKRGRPRKVKVDL